MAVAAEPSTTDVAASPDPVSGPVTARSVQRIAIALVLVPLAVSAIVLIVRVGSDYHALSDNAANELHTGDVPHHLVLLGPYSRDGWNHPGPAMFYLLALPYLLGLRHSIGMALGALLINGGAIVGMALVARRRGGTALLLFTLVGSAVVVRALGADFIRNWWNPYITVLPFGLLVMLTWAMTCGEAWALPVGVGVASFCAQTHIAYVPLAVPLVAWGATGLLLVRARAQRSDRPAADPLPRALGRATLIAAAVLVVMWLPPLVEQLIHSPGNLTRVARYFRHPPDPVHTFAQGFRVVIAQFGLTPEWLVGADKLKPFSIEPTSLSTVPPPWLLLPFLAAIVVCWRRKLVDAYRLAWTIVLGLVLSVVAVARTSGYAYAYRLRWIWMLGMLAFVVVAWAGWSVISTRRPDVRFRWVAVLSLAALVVLAGLNSYDAATAGTPESPRAQRLAKLLPQAARGLPRGDGAVIIRSTSFGGSVYAAGLVLGLERRGVATRIDGNDRAHGLGDQRYFRRGPIRAVLYVAVDTDIDAFVSQRGLRLIAYVGTRSLSERTRLARRRATLEAAYRSKRIGYHALVVGVQSIAAQTGTAVAVFMKVPVPTPG